MQKSQWVEILYYLFEKIFITYVSFIPFFIFGFRTLLATKLRKYYVIFVYILQGRKKGKENLATKVTKISKTKRRNYGPEYVKSCFIVLVVQCLLQNNMTLESRNLHTIETETASDSLHDVRG